ncbi:leucyl/phenylalanyl-tRNA--protein transferase [Fodinicurvata sp. EGI_FJ10296]|uniref:leucyl/phenylalanyl-tRNA--protein transferase n=1 Tax=Fodinicurvata sp. EGI_FJ10296 TaxID=3231908 RepID=UPI0034523FAD
MSDNAADEGPPEYDASGAEARTGPVITPSLILKAYSVGLFPMAESADDPELMWIDPDIRGVIPLDDGFHVPRSLAKALRKTTLTFTIDLAFDAVMAGCAAPAPGRRSTWINRPIRNLYHELHVQGHAHSIECWQHGRDRPELVGGIYGIKLGAAFFGESMFARRTNASKMCLVRLVETLRAGGFRLFDAQFVTEHLCQFGAREMPRADYRALLTECLDCPGVWPSAGTLPRPGIAASPGTPSD